MYILYIICCLLRYFRTRRARRLTTRHNEIHLLMNVEFVVCLSIYGEREREREFGNEKAIGCRRRNDAMPLERRKSGECGDGRIYWDLERRRRREQQGGGRQRAFEDEANSLDSPNRSAIQLFLLALFDMETVC